MSGTDDVSEILNVLMSRFPEAGFVLTLGKEGAVYRDRLHNIFQPIFPAEPVDTTAAGDTFTGYMLALFAAGDTMERAMELASKAAAIAVTRKGATVSIPAIDEVL